MQGKIIQTIRSLARNPHAVRYQTLKSGVSLFYCTVKAAQLNVVRGVQTILFLADDVSDPASIGLPYKSLKTNGGSVRFELHSENDLTQLIQVFRDVLERCYIESHLDTFGCCNSHVECSNAKQCIHLDDPIYWGCIYRENLEEGRIFYGKNATV